MPAVFDKRRWFVGIVVMNRRGSALPVCVAALAAVFSAPTMAKNLEDELLWMLQTQANANETAPGSMEVLNKLGLP